MRMIIVYYDHSKGKTPEQQEKARKESNIKST